MTIRDLLPFNWGRAVARRSARQPAAPVRRDAPVTPWRLESDPFFAALWHDWPQLAWTDSSLTPRVNIRETDHELVVEAELPGLEERDIDLAMAPGALVLRGEKRHEHRSEDDRACRVECAYGRFERTIPLPEDVEAEKATATYRHGVLRVTIPRDERRATGRRIPISVG